MNILENVICEEEHNAILDFINSGNFPLFYYGDSGIEYNPIKVLRDTTKEFPVFSHTFVLDKKLNSGMFDLIKNICSGIESEINKIDDRKLTLLRARINITTNQPNLDNKYHTNFHIDSYDDGYTAIYYINESDGNTLICDGEKIIAEVIPKKGKTVFFKNNVLHAIRTPRLSSSRIILNINWVI